MLTTKKAADGRVRVGFSLPSEVEAEHVAVSGEFNGWSAGLPMKRVKSGEWRASVALDAGRRYRFRYLLDGVRWENDWAADAYVPNPFGGDDSVVDLTALAGGIPPIVKRTTAKPATNKKAISANKTAAPESTKKGANKHI